MAEHFHLSLLRDYFLLLALTLLIHTPDNGAYHADETYECQRDHQQCHVESVSVRLGLLIEPFRLFLDPFGVLLRYLFGSVYV